MKISIRTVVLGAALMIGTALPVAAQDLGFGYQFQTNSSVGETRTYPFGIAADVAFPVNSAGTLAVFGQFDWSHRGEDDETYSSSVIFYGAGIRQSFVKNPKIKPFVEVALGANHYSVPDVDVSDDSFALQIGGGVAGPLTGSLDWVGQVDYRRIFTEDEGSNAFRFVIGVRLNLKK